MKTNYILGLLMVFLVFICSCKKELEPQESSVVTNPSSSGNTSISTATPSGPSANSFQNPSLLQQNSNQNVSGMNPPHGQPGHRCDIAVGAPLNSTPNNKSIPTPAVTNSSAPTIIKSNAAAVVTKPGMNPPHGQKGHRCEIAVGAPLNSQSVKNVPVPAVSNSDSNSQVPTLLKQDSTATSPK